MPRSANRPIDKAIAEAIIAEATPRAKRVNGCLIWPDRLDQNTGYGVTAWGGFRAHRLAFTAAYHDPGDLLVRHAVCGNPSCFDWQHLAEGTDADNAADTSRMGRRHNTRLLTPDLVAEAVEAINAGATLSATAKAFGVGQATMSRAVAGLLDPSVNSARQFRKATDAEVLQARRDYVAGRATFGEIAKRLGMSQPGAHGMVRGRTYQHVPEAYTGPAIRSKPVSCTVPGCGRVVLARGWCVAHYNRWKAHGDVLADKPLKKHSRMPDATPYGVPQALDEDRVRLIRRRYASGDKVAHIARDLGVAHGTVKAVVDGRTWAHVTG